MPGKSIVRVRVDNLSMAQQIYKVKSEISTLIQHKRLDPLKQTEDRFMITQIKESVSGVNQAHGELEIHIQNSEDLTKEQIAEAHQITYLNNSVKASSLMSERGFAKVCLTIFMKNQREIVRIFQLIQEDDMFIEIFPEGLLDSIKALKTPIDEMIHLRSDTSRAIDSISKQEASLMQIYSILNKLYTDLDSPSDPVLFVVSNAILEKPKIHIVIKLLALISQSMELLPTILSQELEEKKVITQKKASVSLFSKAKSKKSNILPSVNNYLSKLSSRLESSLEHIQSLVTSINDEVDPYDVKDLSLPVELSVEREKAKASEKNILFAQLLHPSLVIAQDNTKEHIESEIDETCHLYGDHIPKWLLLSRGLFLGAKMDQRSIGDYLAEINKTFLEDKGVGANAFLDSNDTKEHLLLLKILTYFEMHYSQSIDPFNHGRISQVMIDIYGRSNLSKLPMQEIIQEMKALAQYTVDPLFSDFIDLANFVSEYTLSSIYLLQSTPQVVENLNDVIDYCQQLTQKTTYLALIARHSQLNQILYRLVDMITQQLTSTIAYIKSQIPYTQLQQEPCLFFIDKAFSSAEKQLLLLKQKTQLKEKQAQKMQEMVRRFIELDEHSLKIAPLQQVVELVVDAHAFPRNEDKAALNSINDKSERVRFIEHISEKFIKMMSDDSQKNDQVLFQFIDSIYLYSKYFYAISPEILKKTVACLFSSMSIISRKIPTKEESIALKISSKIQEKGRIESAHTSLEKFLQYYREVMSNIVNLLAHLEWITPENIELLFKSIEALYAATDVIIDLYLTKEDQITEDFTIEIQKNRKAFKSFILNLKDEFTGPIKALQGFIHIIAEDVSREKIERIERQHFAISHRLMILDHKKYS